MGTSGDRGIGSGSHDLKGIELDLDGRTVWAETGLTNGGVQGDTFHMSR